MLWYLKHGLITAVITLLFYFVGTYLLPYSGDGRYVVQLVEEGWSVLMHSVLTTIIHKLFYAGLHPIGFDEKQAIILSSAIAGALAVQILYAIRPHPVFLFINTASGSFLVFMGMVEHYAWVNCCFLASIYWMERYIKKQSSMFPAMLFLCLGCLFHMMLIFYLPAYFWVMKRDQRFAVWEFLLPFGLLILGYIGFNLLMPREGLFMDTSRLVPWFSIQRKGQFFTLFSQQHLELLFFFHQKGAFLGVPFEIPVLILLRKRIHSLFAQYLLICTLMGYCWTTFWHPDLGPLDWDLFSQMFIATHVLLGVIICDENSFKGWTFPSKY